MEKHGVRKPIWLTEFGYYADDEPWIVPMIHERFDRPLESERLQAEYAMRWIVIMLANGVDRVFYHAGTSCDINDDSLQGVFYKYAGTPHKIYAAQAVAAHPSRLCGVAIEHQDRPRDSILDGESARRLEGHKLLC